MTSAQVLVPADGSKARPKGVLRSGLAASLHRPVLVVFCVALFVRVALALIIWQRYGGALFGDDLTYPQLAQAKVDGSSGTWDSYTQYLYDSTRTLMLPLTLLHRVFGPSLLIGQLWVALFGALTAAGAAKLAAMTWSRPAGLIAGLIVALLPSQVLWSSLTLKDAVVWTALVGLALAVSMAARAGTLRQQVAVLVAAVAMLLALAYLRQHTLVIASWALALASWAGPSDYRWRRGLAAATVCLVVPWTTGLGPAGWQLITSHGSLEARRANNAANAATAFVPDPTGADPAKIAAQVEAKRLAAEAKARADRQALLAAQTHTEAERARAAARQAGSSTGGSAVSNEAALATLARAEAAERAAKRALERAKADAAAREAAAAKAAAPTPTKPGLDEAFGGASRASSDNALEGNLRQLPTGLSVMLLRPYPWVATGNSHVDAVRAEMLLWYPLLAMAFVGLAEFRRRLQDVAFPTLAAGGILLTYALSEGNLGTAFRHRGEVVWIIAVLAAGGITSLAARMRAR